MSIEYLPVGIACNLKCEYCYQDPMRDAGNITTAIDWSAARAQLEKENYQFSVFGGEPLLAPIEHLEEVFKFGYERFGRNAIQTNGTLITEKHIELFKIYKVGVGISVDGPGHLNDARVPHSAAGVELTNQLMENIERLCEEGIAPSLIVTLNKHNAVSFERVGLLIEWLEWLEEIGVPSVNFHILETEPGKESLAPTDEQNIAVFNRLFHFWRISRMVIKPFEDVKRLLLQEELNKVSCIWNACDPLTTDAVHGVTADGTRSNCGRTNKDGVNWVKADKPGFERYMLLHATPQENGGCRGCEFFVFCKGQCPGTAIDNDWRNRTVHCRVWFEIFKMVEADILLENRLPASREPKTIKALEDRLLGEWQRGLSAGSISHGDAHGDIPHSDAPHGDSHGDAPHGDNHGDSDTRTQVGVPVTWI